jgi:hypothetical protein
MNYYFVFDGIHCGEYPADDEDEARDLFVKEFGDNGLISSRKVTTNVPECVI